MELLHRADNSFGLLSIYEIHFALMIHIINNDCQHFWVSIYNIGSA